MPQNKNITQVGLLGEGLGKINRAIYAGKRGAYQRNK
jgi:hypothetical protein